VDPEELAAREGTGWVSAAERRSTGAVDRPAVAGVAGRRVPRCTEAPSICGCPRVPRFVLNFKVVYGTGFPYTSYTVAVIVAVLSPSADTVEGLAVTPMVAGGPTYTAAARPACPRNASWTKSITMPTPRCRPLPSRVLMIRII
jgi:hypothetical protein